MSTFWSTTIKGNDKKSSTIPEDKYLTLSSICLVEGKVAKISITIDETKCHIATLVEGVCPQHILPLSFYPGSKVVFENESADSTVVFNGSLNEYLDEDDFDDEDMDDIDDEIEGDEDEEEEEEEKKEEKKEGKKEKPAPKKVEKKEEKKEEKKPEKKTFKCEECGRAFNSEQAKEQHKNSKHKH